MKYVLFNPLSNNKHGKDCLKDVLELIKEENEIKSLLDLDKKDFFQTLTKKMKLY